MAQPDNNTLSYAFKQMFDREKLTGNNFNDWFRQLRIVLRVAKRLDVLEQPLALAPPQDLPNEVLEA